MDNTYSSVFPPVPSTGPGTLPAAQPRAQQAQPPHVQGRQHPPVDQTKLEQRSVAPVDPSPPDSAASEPGGQLPIATAVPRRNMDMTASGPEPGWDIRAKAPSDWGQLGLAALDDLKFNLNEL